MRFILRLVSLLFLVAAVMVGIIDSIQSVASSTVSLTPLGAALFSLNPGMVDGLERFVEARMPAYVWDDVMRWVLMQPAIVVFITLSLLFWVLAFKREPAAGRFAA